MSAKNSNVRCGPARTTCKPALEQLEDRRLLSTFVASTFDTGSEGWTTYGDVRPNPLSWLRSGGNPGGYLQAVDILDARTFYWRAPAKFHGNFSAAYGR